MSAELTERGEEAVERSETDEVAFAKSGFSTSFAPVCALGHLPLKGKAFLRAGQARPYVKTRTNNPAREKSPGLGFKN